MEAVYIYVPRVLSPLEHLQTLKFSLLAVHQLRVHCFVINTRPGEAGANPKALLLQTKWQIIALHPIYFKYYPMPRKLNI